MASLRAVFRLFDGYSTTADKIIRKTDTATIKIMKASGATDNFNDKLEATGVSATKASSGLGKFLSITALIAGSVKGMSIADEYINTSSRLDLINDGLQTQAELQDKIFAAANRSKGSYTAMAGAISKMGITASEAFGSNDELIAFTELIQKGFKVGGASSTEQSSAMLQLTQAMGAGKLQGDEFRSIMENAPMIADAIAKYTGKSKGELKELSSEGLITSDIIKNAMFMAGDDINAKFKTMPYTFSDIGNKIKNGVLKAFAPIIEAVSGFINSDAFADVVGVVITGVNILSAVVSGLIDFIVGNWPVIQAILMAIGAFLLYQLIGYLTAAIPVLAAHVALWLAMNAPVLAIIALVAGIIFMFSKMGVTVEDVFGFIGGVIGAAVAVVWNLFLALLDLVLGVINAFINPFVNIANFIGNVFHSPISAVIYMFQGMADGVLSVLQKIASAMDFVFGSNMAGTISGWRTGLKDMADAAVAEYAPNENYKKVMDSLDLSASDFGLERMNYSDAWKKGSSIGKDVYGGLADAISGLTDTMTDAGTEYDPTVVKGLGDNGKVEVDMSDEDLKYLRDIAERDFINKFTSNALAPKVSFVFGDIHETADVDKVKGRLEYIMREEIAMAAEGSY